MKNIGKITINHTLDLVAIAEAAGNSAPEARWYDTGVLYVRGVTDEALAAAAAKAMSPGEDGNLLQRAWRSLTKA